MNDIFYWLEELDDLSYNKVKDYITNLQQIEQEHQKINGELREENQNLLEEIHRITISSYEQGKQDYKELNEDYKSRCEKAIEYINKLKTYPYLEKYYTGELLNILQNGSEKDE